MSRLSRARAAVVRRVDDTPDRSRRLVLRVLAGAVLIGLVVVAVLGWSAYRAGAVRAESQAALDAAKLDTEQLLSINTISVDADLARASGVVAEPFASQFKRTAAEVIAPATRQRLLLTRTTAVRAGIIAFQPDRAEVLVYLNQSTSSGAAPGPPEVATSQVREVLVKVGDRWLISEFQPL